MKKWRKWIDLFLFYFSLILVISGVVLYIMPHGRVAYFTGWTFLGLDKDQWDGLHIISGLVIGVVAVIHTIINWKPLKNYLFKRESLLALGITGVVIAGTITNFPPFKWVFQLEESIKNSWDVNRYQIPIAHGELLTLAQFCQKLGIPLSKAEELLKKRGIQFTPSQTLKEIGEKNGLTPVKIYQIIKPAGEKKPTLPGNNSPQTGNSSSGKNFPPLQPGSGIGFLTISQFCQKYGCNPSQVLENLHRQGIEADSQTPLREIARSNGIPPYQLATEILKMGR